jgi:hypothetical protein
LQELRTNELFTPRNPRPTADPGQTMSRTRLQSPVTAGAATPPAPDTSVYAEIPVPTPLTKGSRTDERIRLLTVVWAPFIREALKLVVIIAYLVFAIWLCFDEHNPAGFVPLLPWALGIHTGPLIRSLRRKVPSNPRR